jgi:hypothetical protein
MTRYAFTLLSSSASWPTWGEEGAPPVGGHGVAVVGADHVRILHSTIKGNNCAGPSTPGRALRLTLV